MPRMFLFAKHAAEEKIGVREQLSGEEKGAGYFSVVTSSGRVLEALSKDEKLVPIVQAVQNVSMPSAVQAFKVQ
jgi:hypothetical protein